MVRYARFIFASVLLLFAMLPVVERSQHVAARAEPEKPEPKKFPTGAKPTPRHILLAAPQFKPTQGMIDRSPAQMAYVPARLSMWGNNQYGDCVTAEEAFKCACYLPEIFIDDAVVIAWARAHGVLNGATLTEVMDAMQTDGFKVGNQQYNDGPYKSVDYSNESILQAALVQGPVKIGLDSSALPSGAGNKQGWVAVGGRPGQFSNEDHSVPICGYGTAQYLFSRLNVPLPSGLDGSKAGYLVFTWSTIGFVDHAWIMSTVGEAWIRNPPTVGVPPLQPQPSAITITMPPFAARAGKPATFAATASGGTAPYQWVFDYGDGSKGTVPAHTWAVAGTFNITATASDTTGAVGTGSSVATVTTGPQPPPPGGPIVSIVATLSDGSTQTLNALVTSSTTVGELTAKAVQSSERTVVPAKGQPSTEAERILGVLEKMQAQNEELREIVKDLKSRLDKIEKQPMKP